MLEVSFVNLFTYGIVAAVLMQGRPIPITIVPCVILSLILLVLTWRLSKGYA